MNALAESPSKQLSFFWSPNHQRFACDDLVSESFQPICTEPSHDLVHLIIAANESMLWLPHGDREKVCWAEYNAVFLENLFDKTCNAIAFGTATSDDVLGETLQYMDWFVNEHYAPFPVSATFAARRFCEQIDAFLVASLFPYYLQLKRHERSQSDYRSDSYQIDFTSRDRPPVDELGWLAQWFVYRQLQAAKTRFGFALEASGSCWKIEGALTKIDRASFPSPLLPSKGSEIESLERRLSHVEHQLTEVKSVLLTQIKDIAPSATER